MEIFIEQGIQVKDLVILDRFQIHLQAMNFSNIWSSYGKHLLPQALYYTLLLWIPR